RDPVQPARRQHRQMLQVALAPAPVARGEIQQGRWTFLETAAERGRHPDRPSSTSHQRCFDEIVAQYMPAKRLAALQVWQPGVPRKRTHANDRVVAPIIALGAMPPCNAGRYHRTV